MIVQSTALWRSAPRHALAWREWDGELVVRHAGTGDTHLLSPVGRCILLALVQAESAISVPALAKALPAEEADELDRIALVEATLSEFQQLELAAPEYP
jgi:PqqD family protein of HPr-rel-A system